MVMATKSKIARDKLLTKLISHKENQENSNDVTPSTADGTTIESSEPENKTPMTTSETAKGLESEDPWMQRKREESNTNESGDNVVVV